MTEPQSALLLRRQLAELNKNPVEGFSAGLIDDNDLYRWEVLIIGPPDTLYEGGVFKAHLTFPKDYPLRPPKMKFITEIWHPNVDKSGDVCISILHEPGEDKYGYEKPEERWLPIHTVETIMISVISMLADPNGDSPANVDAAKEWREDRNGEFKRKLHLTFQGLLLGNGTALFHSTLLLPVWSSPNTRRAQGGRAVRGGLMAVTVADRETEKAPLRAGHGRG
ncbi:hypothetical protein ANANG_G00240850 [Anguilla anguilla]|uniref:Ubiquitin-conjugating enzyme E2 G1 n=1 Tax=Anguilla anguilla TaxID=7936 RepID=A0A9D3RPG7_ANGAN|nr:hypothetical protein ANANG_G00240850 [Anguilla anguilla]